jgi:hypothetical protein
MAPRERSNVGGPAHDTPSLVVRVVGRIGMWVVAALISVFGRVFRREEVAWLDGPIGGPIIGDSPYAQVAAEEGLTLERQARSGLIPDFEALRSESFDPSACHPLVRDFYEHTSDWTMDIWSRTRFPMNIGLWLMVTTISREVDQLNFPLTSIESALGVTSELISMRRPDGQVRYTGWFRTLESTSRVLYTGFYMTESPPLEAGPCVKVVFPMPDGNATVILSPELAEGGALVLRSAGERMGGTGFYRLTRLDAERLRVWQVTSLKETFRVYVDGKGVPRCDHHVRFWGLPVLELHYKLSRSASA